ncbi:MAG TPA: ABC transporter ATP-binding protein, partial [Ktedonobacteraceae bacterium]|nr:ABC transporter ATP-binding protein [Ktedonobacteraceae bacterium]
DVSIAATVDRTIAIRDGRTSTETVRRESALEALEEHIPRSSAVIGLPTQTHRESILIDRAGRLQLPREAIEKLPFHGRAEVHITDDHVEIWPVLSNGENMLQEPADQEEEQQ